MNAALGLRAAFFAVDLPALLAAFVAGAFFAGAAFFAVFFVGGIGALLMDDDDPVGFWPRVLIRAPS